MNPLAPIRKLARIMRGGAGSTQIVLACLLGVLIGMNPGVNLTLVVTILLLGGVHQ